MARKKKKKDDLELLEEEEKDEEEAAVFKTRKQKRIERSCRSSIRNLSLVQPFWLIFVAVAFVGGISLLMAINSGSMKPANFGFESWAIAGIFGFCTLLGLTRIFSNSGSMKGLRDRKLYLSSDLPTESDNFIRELYLYYCKRRCVHFWLSFGMACFFMLFILYSVVAVGVDSAAQWGAPTKCKLFTGGWKDYKTAFFRGESDDLTHKFTILGGWGVISVLAQYFVLKRRYASPIRALEEKYGKDQIIDECLYCNKMQSFNFKYKSFAFIIVCLFGCLFYLFLKRLICIIFDKSFSV